MVEKFENWGDCEIGMIAKEFMECEKRSSCADCPCSYVLCGIENINETREAFVREFARRVMA